MEKLKKKMEKERKKGLKRNKGMRTQKMLGGNI